jgi:hypothetical protein
VADQLQDDAVGGGHAADQLAEGVGDLEVGAGRKILEHLFRY